MMDEFTNYKPQFEFLKDLPDIKKSNTRLIKLIVKLNKQLFHDPNPSPLVKDHSLVTKEALADRARLSTPSVDVDKITFVGVMKRRFEEEHAPKEQDAAKKERLDE